MADECPNCGNTLTYDHYMDSMKCLFCNYRQSIAIPTHIEEDNSRRPLPYNHKFVRSVSLTKHIYDRISHKLKEKGLSHSEVLTYYLIEKVKESKGSK